MNIDEYRMGGRALYEGLAKTTALILEAAIRAHGGFRLQQIQARAKTPESIQTKLSRAGQGTDSLDLDLKDLAGVRIVFYTNSDISLFLRANLLTENFVVDWDRTKVHGPAGTEATAADHFISHNFVVKLKPERAALPEYALYVDRFCEVQVQTTLNHAWAEMAHDTIYKKPNLERLGTAAMERIEARMKAIMQERLLPAGYEFQRVVQDITRLESGRAIFDLDPLASLPTAIDNNVRLETLEKYVEHVLPLYDDLDAEASDILRCMVETIRAAWATAPQKLETPFGKFAGYEASKVVELAARVMDRLRYLQPNALLDALILLYPEAPDQQSRKYLLSAAEHLSENNMQAWRQIGPHIQDVIVQRLGMAAPADLLAALPLVAECLEQVLRSDIRGTTSTYEAVTFHQGAVRPSATHLQIRRAALDIVERLFVSVGTQEAHGYLAQAFSSAMSAPQFGVLTSEHYASILDDTTRIVRFYLSAVGCMSFETIQATEHKLLWLYRRNRGEPPRFLGSADVEAARLSVLRAIENFRDTINQDADFTT